MSAPETPTVAKARIEAQMARARLMGTLHEIQAKIAPRNIAQEAWEGVRDRGSDLANSAVAVAKKQPIALAAAGGVLAAEPELGEQGADVGLRPVRHRLAERAGQRLRA